MDKKEYGALLEEYDILNKAFDNVRLIDPVNKQIIDLHKEVSGPVNMKCFDFWGRNKVCDNCVSVRAFHDNKTYIKLEYNSDEIYVVTAIPVDLPDRRVVVEIFKKATNSLVLGVNESEGYAELHELIDKMNNLALKDTLTGLYNRRFINEKLPIDVANAAISGMSISIIMIDIDYFKRTNDNYGHLNGDCALTQFAKLLASCLKRESDWIARYGGEEFLVCLPGANTIKAVEIAEKMRKKIENTEIECGPEKVKITASFGVATKTAGMNFSLEELIDFADRMLYKAKRNGRNRVEA